MIYAYLVDGLDFAHREEFDRLLVAPDKDDKDKARSERQAVQSLFGVPGVVGGA